MLYGAPTARRRDAQRNRAAIVLAANEVLAGSDAVAPIPEIARRAGVGQATLYRHFADRNALTAAVIEYQLERLEEAAASLAGEPDGFRRLLHAVLHNQMTMRGLVTLVRRLDPATQERYRLRAVAALTGPMLRARELGNIRPDLKPADISLLFVMVQGVGTAPSDADRAIALVLDGICRP
ncbi:helix-turn-helix domain-containing protein [Actinoplanes sp. NPDC051851]|uniref:helix-turn-helix domain-containing protein n=1 Tax=Actinoplanes sp. NPDC051851 TaxID=3154753 RepID=UPI00341880AB